MILITILLILILIYFWGRNKVKRKLILLSKIPGLPKYPLIHHIPYVFNNKTSDHFYFLVNLGKKFGGVYHLSFGDFIDPYIFVSDAKIVEGFLTNYTELDKGIDYDLLKPWIGTGLATSTDKKWFQRRKVCMSIL
jgi:cytochrome P450 family 4